MVKLARVVEGIAKIDEVKVYAFDVGAAQVGAGEDRPWDNRGHFSAAAAEAMRRILLDRAAAST